MTDSSPIDHTPVVIFAYTVKGWGLPFAGDPLNHSQLLTQTQMDALREKFGIPDGGEWNAFSPNSPAGQYCAAAAARLELSPDDEPGPPEPRCRRPPALSRQRRLRRGYRSAAVGGGTA